MKQPGTEAKLRRLLASILQIMGEVPAHGDGQGRSLFAKNFCDPPSLLAVIFGNPSAQDLRVDVRRVAVIGRSEEHTSELQSLMRISYAVFCLNKKNYA